MSCHLRPWRRLRKISGTFILSILHLLNHIGVTSKERMTPLIRKYRVIEAEWYTSPPISCEQPVSWQFHGVALSVPSYYCVFEALRAAAVTEAAYDIKASDCSCAVGQWLQLGGNMLLVKSRIGFFRLGVR